VSLYLASDTNINAFVLYPLPINKNLFTVECLYLYLWFLNSNVQKKLTDRILLERNGVIENFTLSVPIIIIESNYDKFDNKNVEITVSSVELNKHSQSAIQNAVMPNVENLLWQKKSAIDKEVQSEFSKLLSSANTSQRVKDMASKMFIANNYQTIQSQ
jgi:hypothetical protein